MQSTARRRASPTSCTLCPTPRQGRPWAAQARRTKPPSSDAPFRLIPTVSPRAPLQGLIFYKSVKAGVLLGVEQGQGFVIARWQIGPCACRVRVQQPASLHQSWMQNQPSSSACPFGTCCFLSRHFPGRV
jgi:hypothetical protein